MTTSTIAGASGTLSRILMQSLAQRDRVDLLSRQSSSGRVASLYGESGTAQLLIASQVVLSLQLPFAVYPLVRFTGDRGKMGDFANRPVLALAAWVICAAVIVLNLVLLYQVVTG